MTMTARCRSRSAFGNCGRPQHHPGDHAVPIGDDVWFGYTRRSQQQLGYGHLHNGEFRRLW